MKHEFTMKAEQDYEEATLYYRSISKRLADFFFEEIESGIVSIKKFPKAWPQMDQKTRCFFGDKFSYGIYYRIVENTILIGGILNLKRNPELWKKRFK